MDLGVRAPFMKSFSTPAVHLPCILPFPFDDDEGPARRSVSSFSLNRAIIDLSALLSISVHSTCLPFPFAQPISVHAGFFRSSSSSIIFLRGFLRSSCEDWALFRLA